MSSKAAQEQQQVIKRCQSSVHFFLRNFCKTKHPSAGILPFDPFKYQIKALQSFRDHRFTIFRKCRQCFAGESMIWGPNGPKRIDKIIKGDLVYSYDEKLGTLVVVPVEEIYDNGERECVRVQTKTGHDTIATFDHKYFTEAGCVQAGYLTQADTLIEINEPERYGIEANESEAILLGYLLTDGYYKKTIHFTNTCFRYLLEFQKHLKLRFNYNGRIVKHGCDENGKVNSWRINVFNSDVKDWLESLGILGQIKHRKIVPTSVFRWNNRSLAVLINRMFAGDGWYSGSHCNEAGLCSESLITLHQVKQLLSRFNINSKVFKATKRGMPKLRIFGSRDFQIFVERIGIFNKNPRCEITKGFFFNRKKGAIKKITAVGNRRVYDIKVPPHHSYIVDGAVVHNSGISKISGSFALWFAMFFNHKTVLIVSRSDDTAMDFLRDNVAFVFKNLPEWMQSLWKPVKDNEHEIQFPNGSRIKSLTSHPDVLRSNASSLNIIDEAAFIEHMNAMWAAGYPTLTHGGSVIVISTSNGVGDWYWNTWMDAENGLNDFHPIFVRWYDMDWRLEYKDALSGKPRTISPTDGIRPCTTPEDIMKYGEFWSPWLEEQYRGLQERGEGWKFEQEVLAKFVGSGNTILDAYTLAQLTLGINTDYKVIAGKQAYVHPNTGESMYVEFDGGDGHVKSPEEGMWVWEKPYTGRSPVMRGNRLIDPGEAPFSYVAGLDLATGKGKDYHALEIFCVDTQTQVAELMIRCLPRVLRYIVDFVCRWYNNALLNIERNNGGDAFIDEMRLELMYPNLWRKKIINDGSVNYGEYGFMTTTASKPKLNKCLQDYLIVGSDESTQPDTEVKSTHSGIVIRSSRLVKQAHIYVRKKDKLGRDTQKTEAEDGPGNFDDLVIATGLVLIAWQDGMTPAVSGLLPFDGVSLLDRPPQPNDTTGKPKRFDQNCLMPMGAMVDVPKDMSIMQELERFTKQIGALPTSNNIVVSKKRY